MTWQAPLSSSMMPNAGRVSFDWSAHPDAKSYKVLVTQPGETLLDESLQALKGSWYQG